MDIVKGPSQIEEAHAAYISKVQAIENLHYTIGHVSLERAQHLIENGQWSCTHPSKPTNFVKDLANAKRFSFRGPINMPDVQGPLEVRSF